MQSSVAAPVAAVKHSQAPTGVSQICGCIANSTSTSSAVGYQVASLLFRFASTRFAESTCARTGLDSLLLADLPLAWLHRFSTFLTAEAAARLRSTCGLLQKVVDATWEPVEVPVPAHRHIVPLTFEQVKAQLPPDKPWPQKWLEVAEARAHRPKPSVWVEDFVAAAAATFDPLIAAAIAADSGGPADRGVGPSSSSGGIASSADEPGRAAFWSEVSPRLSVLDCLPTHPRDKFMFDPSACDSAQLQQIAERFRPLVQAKGPSSAGSVGDCIRQLLTPQYSSSDYYSSPRVSFGSRWSGAWGSSDSEDEDLDVERVDGCDTYWSDIFGPALTCLTANQAVNMPQGCTSAAEPMLLFESPWNSELTKYSTVWARMTALREFTFENLRVQWPPRQDEPEGESDDHEWCVSRECWAAFHAYEEVQFGARVNVPVEVREERDKNRCTELCTDWQYVAWPSTEQNLLLVTTYSSCREATVMERKQFEAEILNADTASTGDRFDMYLSFPLNCGSVDEYVFLEPCVCRFTARPIGTTQVQAGGDA